MSFLKRLISPLQHYEDAAIQLCKKLGVKITQTSLQKDIIEHPDYPGLTSIMDVLKNYGIANEAFTLPLENFKHLSFPFIAIIRGEKLQRNLFVPVYQLNEKSIDLYNPESGNNEQWNKETFGKYYQGIVMAVETNDNTGEQDYNKKLIRERQQSAINYLLVFVLPFITLIACVSAFVTNPVIHTIVPILFTIMTLAGCVVSVLILWLEIDQYNPTLNRVCQGGKKMNCSAILNSKASKIFGLGWSRIGLCYFLSILFSLLIAGITTNTVLQLVSWINVMALPFISFSIYYQWIVVKQWCLLCLIVQCLLFFQFITAIIGGFHNLLPLTFIPITSFFTVLFSTAFISIAVLLLIPALEKAKESRQKCIELQRLKHNPQIFEAVLAKQKKAEKSTDNLGIIVGTSNARYKLVKVCNPYCRPCATAHSAIEKLLENNDEVQIQTIFTATGDDDDIKNAPVRHLLAIAGKGSATITKMALNDWYLADRKDYNAFAVKYPMNAELEEQNDKIRAMKEWCKATEISFTPTFFINGYQVPEMYTVNDLKYILTY